MAKAKKTKIARPTKREVMDEHLEMERRSKGNIAIASGRPGRGKTKWALLAANLNEAVVVVRQENLDQTHLLVRMGGFGPNPPQVISYEELMDGLNSDYGPKKVVLDDYLEAFERGEVPKIPELEQDHGVEIVALTFASRAQ